MRNGEETNQRGDKVDAVLQIETAERHTRMTADGIETDATEEQAKDTGEHTLDDRVSSKAGNDRKTEERKQEVLKDRELQGKRAERGRNEQHRDRADGAADAGADRCNAHRLHAAALLGELEAVDGSSR